jgi:hypothetical protein
MTAAGKSGFRPRLVAQGSQHLARDSTPADVVYPAAELAAASVGIMRRFFVYERHTRKENTDMAAQPSVGAPQGYAPTLNIVGEHVTVPASGEAVHWPLESSQ